MQDGPAPLSGDVLLSHSKCTPHAQCYSISVVPGPAQLCIRNRARAIAYATDYAARASVDVWLRAATKHTRLTQDTVAALP